MRILIAVPVLEFLDHYDTVLRQLADRGHDIRIAVTRLTDRRESSHLTQHPRISITTYPARRADAWSDPVLTMRTLRDYVHYQDPRYVRAPAVRDEARLAAAHRLVTSLEDGAGTFSPWSTGATAPDWLPAELDANARAALENLMRLTEETIPPDAAYDEFLRAEQPDLLLVTPLMRTGGAPAADLVKSARALGIRCALLVFSWDNLTTRGLIHVMPDRVFAWNDAQAQDALMFHGVAADRIVITGAPRFDEFFERTPTLTRDAFCERLGLDPAQPIVTYLCSAGYLTLEEEHTFVVEWSRELREHPALARCNVIVRLHPTQRQAWVGGDLTGPATIMDADTMLGDQSLCETLHHSAAIVALNTSAELEAAIAGRPVFTLREFAGVERQQGCLHFWHLLKEYGGFVESAFDYETHREQIAAACRGEYDRDAIRAFVERFIRPGGLDRTAADVLAAAIDHYASTRESV